MNAIKAGIPQDFAYSLFSDIFAINRINPNSGIKKLSILKITGAFPAPVFAIESPHLHRQTISDIATYQHFAIA